MCFGLKMAPYEIETMYFMFTGRFSRPSVEFALTDRVELPVDVLTQSCPRILTNLRKEWRLFLLCIRQPEWETKCEFGSIVFVSKYPAKTFHLPSNMTRRKMNAIHSWSNVISLCICVNNAVVVTKFVGPFNGYQSTKTATSSSADDSFICHCLVCVSSRDRRWLVTRSNLDQNLSVDGEATSMLKKTMRVLMSDFVIDICKLQAKNLKILCYRCLSVLYPFSWFNDWNQEHTCIQYSLHVL